MNLLENILKAVKARTFFYIISIVFLGLFGYMKFYLLPYVATNSIETISEKYGLDITVGGLTTEITDLKVNLENVAWHVRGRYSSNELFEAKQISFDLSLMKLFSSNFDLVSATHDIAVQGAKLHIEHKKSNYWNWQDALNEKKTLRYVNNHYQGERSNVEVSDKKQVEQDKIDVEPHFSLAAIHFDDLKILWVEELPSNSGGGLINRSYSQLYIDDISLVVKNIVGLFQNNDQPMEINFDGRTADGIIQVSGEINLFSWGVDESAKAGGNMLLVNNTNNSKVIWKPTLDLELYLDNVGAAALGQMVPDSAISATSGTMTGGIQVVLNMNQVIDFSTRLTLNNMNWEVNEASTLNKGKRLTYAKRGLKNFKNKSIEIVTSSKGRINDDNFKVIPSIQTAITRKAVRDAPRSVNRIAKNDQRRFEDPQLSPFMKSLTETTKTIRQAKDISEEIGKIQKTTDAIKEYLPFDSLLPF